MELVGMVVRKPFPGFGTYAGVVDSYDPRAGYFRILYEDGDSEEVDFEEISSILTEMGECPPPSGPTRRRSARGRRPKKRRRLDADRADPGASDGMHESNTGAGEASLGPVESEIVVGHGGNFEENGGLLQKENGFPGVLAEQGVLEELEVEKQENLQENSVPECPEGTETEDWLSKACIANQGLPETPGDLGDSEQGQRKRRRLSEKSMSTPTMPLRRSARKASAALLSPSDSIASEKAAKSQNALSSGKQEEFLGEDTKLTLPPSSSDLDAEGLPILDLFSVYTFLRSFSRLLFLSPFSLEAFVAALRCRFTNSLIDSIHFSILQTLKPHLEFLSQEGSQSATDCLRNLNWELLDLVTWPVYLAEYLLLHCSGMRSSLRLSHLKHLSMEYYRHPPEVKLEILRCLCDDVIEVESIRSELSRRMLQSELEADNNTNMNVEKKRKHSIAIDLEASSLAQELCEETNDGNSDECWLCGMDGTLICCDGCPAAFHSRCVGVAKDLLPEGDWYCPECVVAKDDGLVKLSKPFQGAEILGIDPHGRLYFGCSGYLLVCDSYDADSSYHYYNRNDLIAIVEVLKSSSLSYASIANVIIKYCNNTFDASCSSGDCIIETHNAHESLGAQVHSEPLLPSKLDCVSSDVLEKIEHENLASPEHSDLIQSNPATSNQVNCCLSCSEPSDGMADDQKCDQISAQTAADCSTDCTSTSKEAFLKPELGIEQEKHIAYLTWGCSSFLTEQREGRSSPLQSDPGNYVDYYSFGRTASSIAHELMHRSSESNNNESKKPFEDIKSAQLKAVSKRSSKFSCYNQKTSVNAQKEKCGWCYICKTSSDEDCIFKVLDTKHPEGSKNRSVGLRSEKNKKSHIFSAVRHILWLEDRLRILLSGPWEKPHHSKHWRKAVLKASDVATLKHLLLTLESNLRRIAFSVEWLKPVDSVHTVGSSSHELANSIYGTSNYGGSRKHGKKISSGDESGFVPGLYWWRGGSLSRQVFQWKMLPRSLASKGGRQAGCRKISGICYSDGSDFAKRNKYVSWQAAVEMSESIAQLVYQVKDFHANIRWSELSSTHQLPKESKKLGTLFKRVIIRRKCIEGTHVKYLLDFGKRDTIPANVIRHGVMLEESSTGRKKYWLNEAYVPLNILKAFEEKKLGRLLKKEDSLLSEKEIRNDMKKPERSKGLSYLFSRQQKLEKQLCGHCNQDVPIREAVNCQYCNGFFHRKHFRVPKGAAETTYTCCRCRDEMCKKVKDEGCKLKSVKKKISTGKRAGERAKKGKRKQPVRFAKKRKYKPPVKIARKKKHKQGKKAKKGKDVNKKHKRKRYGLKSGNQGQTKRQSSEKSEISISWPKRKRAVVDHSYWLNGLHWARKADDEQGRYFRQTKVLLPPQRTEDPFIHCCLCHKEYNSEVIFIGCQNCEDWFHGAVFCLTFENINNLIGFKCHRCRTRSTPVCPFSNDAAVGKVESDEKCSIREQGISAKDVDDEEKCYGNTCEDDTDVIHNEDCYSEETRDGSACTKEMVLNDKSKSANVLIVSQSLEHAETVVSSEHENGSQAGLPSSKLGDGSKEMAAIPKLLAVGALGDSAEIHLPTIPSTSQLLEIEGSNV